VDLVERLATRVSQLSSTGPRTLIAIDGPDAAGKTSLADRLARVVPLPAVRASLDGFHRPRAVRYARGELSAEGYYRDSFDYQALVDDCLARSPPVPAGCAPARTTTGATPHTAPTPPHPTARC
jgi:uridine kinase